MYQNFRFNCFQSRFVPYTPDSVGLKKLNLPKNVRVLDCYHICATIFIITAFVLTIGCVLATNKASTVMSLSALRLALLSLNTTTLDHDYDMVILSDTETDTETDKRWVVYNVEVFTQHRDRHQHRFSSGSVLIYQYLCHSRSRVCVKLLIVSVCLLNRTF